MYLIALGIVFIIFIWKKYQESIVQPFDESMLDETKPIILYLRSFDADGTGIDMSTTFFPWMKLLNIKFYTHEQGLLNKLRKKAQCIAIGKPGEKIPEIGAYRLYFNDDEWKDKVLSYLERSVLIIMRPSETHGVLWEFEQIFKKGYLSKTIMLRQMGADDSLNVQKVKYKVFCEDVNKLTGVNMPNYSFLNQYIYFDEKNIGKAVYWLNDIPNYKNLFPSNFEQGDYWKNN
jgi:hypothetical protein